MKYLITGGCGFLGSNVAAEALKRNCEVLLFDNLSRIGATENLNWLRSIFSEVKFIHGDTRNPLDCDTAVSGFKPDVIFHFAGQVAMTTSIAQPRKDFEVNTLGTFNILESIRNTSPKTGLIYSSTNKVYGDLEQFNYSELETRYVLEDFPKGLPESITLDFHSPYGCSKGAADQYVLDYSRIYGLKTLVFRHSSMYGGRQFFTTDQGWVGWFCSKAIESLRSETDSEFTISGNGKQVRDLLFADDMVQLYLSASESIGCYSGKAYNIGGGAENSLSILELIDYLQTIIGHDLRWKHIQARESDQKVFVADIARAVSDFNWRPKINSKDGVKRMIEWIKMMPNS